MYVMLYFLFRMMSYFRQINEFSMEYLLETSNTTELQQSLNFIKLERLDIFVRKSIEHFLIF